jgi:hypothetical protein
MESKTALEAESQTASAAPNMGTLEPTTRQECRTAR